MSTKAYTMTEQEFFALGEKLYGADKMKWKFKCPVCGHVQTPEDYEKAGAPSGAVGFSCIGRWLEKSRDAFYGKGEGPCNYTGGGLFRLNPVNVGDNSYFEFADTPETEGKP